LTKNGSQCKKNALKDSRYCFTHSIGKIKDVKWYLNPTVLGVVGIVLTVAFFVLSPSKSDIEELKKLLNKTEQQNSLRLTGKYSAGYILFATDTTKYVIPSRSTVLRDYEINWEGTHVLDISNENITVQLPEIYYRPRSIWIHDIALGMPRNGLSAMARIPIGGLRHDIFGEVLMDKDGHIVFAIGFNEKL